MKIVNEVFIFFYFYKYGAYNIHLGIEGVPLPNNFLPMVDNPELIKRNFFYLMYTTSHIFNLMSFMDWYFIMGKQ